MASSPDAARTIGLAAVVALGSACQNAASPPHFDCLGSATAFSQSTPNLVATVAKITVERGWTPGGFYEVVYHLWLTRPPATEPDIGVMLSDTTRAPTPVFERARNGAITPSAACAIWLGDTVDVWHTPQWALGSTAAPPGDTAYRATQLLIHR